jgi:hypothetical protein
MYEKWYGQPYTPKTLVEVKVCKKCGRKLLKTRKHTTTAHTAADHSEQNTSQNKKQSALLLREQNEVGD